MGTAPLLAKYGGGNWFRRTVSHVSKPFLQIKSYSPKKNHKLPDLSFYPYTHIPQDILIVTCFYRYRSLAHNVLYCCCRCCFKSLKSMKTFLGMGTTFKLPPISTFMWVIPHHVYGTNSNNLERNENMK